MAQVEYIIGQTNSNTRRIWVRGKEREGKGREEGGKGREGQSRAGQYTTIIVVVRYKCFIIMWD